MVASVTPKGLNRLLYFSRFSAAMPREDEAQAEEVDGVIRASIRNNRAHAITGLLLVHQGWFMQALEGPGQAVLATYDRILADPLHQDARVITAGPAEARLFGDWNMCARRLSNTDDAILAGLRMKGDFDPGRLTAVSGLGLLTAVRGTQARTMAARAS